MNCHENENLLSAYYDGELSDELAATVVEHLDQCDACAGELTGIEQLSQLAARLDEPRGSAEIWDAISEELDRRRAFAPERRRFDWLRPSTGLMVVVAASLLVVAFTAGAFLLHLRGEHNNLAMNFDAYLDHFPDHPLQAQQVLLANYGGQRTTLDQAAQTLGYALLAGVRTPAGYAVEEVYLLEMPGCTCAHVVYRHSEGRLIAVIEHDQDQPIRFGDRPAITCQCQGQPTRLVQVNKQHLAVTWTLGERYVTLIGAQDLEEVQDLIGQLTPMSEST